MIGLEAFAQGHTRGSSHGPTRMLRRSIEEGPQYVPLDPRRPAPMGRARTTKPSLPVIDLRGAIRIAPNGSPMHAAFVTSALAWGLDYDHLSADEVNRQFPAFSVPEGYSAMFEHEAGVLFADRTVRALQDRATRNGASLHFDEPVVSWEASGDCGRRADGDRELSRGAARDHRRGVDHRAGRRTRAPARAAPGRQRVVHTAGHPEPFGIDRLPAFVVSDGIDGVYGIPAVDGQGVKVGGGGTPVDPDDVDRVVSDDEIARLRGFVDRFLPGASGPVSSVLTCLYTVAPDGHFVIDRHPEHDNVVIASPCSGHGFKYTTAIGPLLAELAFTGQTTLPIDSFSIARFAPLASHQLTPHTSQNRNLMTSHPIPLSVLDLVPIPSGSTARAGDRQHHRARPSELEAAGYQRYWLAEHHLNPGVAGTTPALLIALIANATRTLRVGSGAVLMGHHTPLAVVEQFGILDAVHPGRIDLGLGRSGFKRLQERTAATRPHRRSIDRAGDHATPRHHRSGRRTENGLLIPPPFSFANLIGSPRAALQISLLQQPNAETPDYAEQIDDILALIGGNYRGADGTEAHVIPGEDAQLDIWILGSSGGDSAEVAGRRGLPVRRQLPRRARARCSRPSRHTGRRSGRRRRCPDPTCRVSADIVVASTDHEARELATGYAPWVRSIRSGEGAIAFPTPDEARSIPWSDDDQALVQDRLDTQFVGSPDRVADQLGFSPTETDADELLITTITHDQRDRVRSYELLADEWAARNQLARVG